MSAAELRDALTAAVQKLDPSGTNALLRQMVVIGHSQGGLLTKLTATSTGDTLWRAVSDKPFEESRRDEDQRARLRRLLFLEPLPFVRRVVFISTPHRGSYLASNFARRLAARFMALPGATVHATRDMASLAKGDSAERFFQGRLADEPRQHVAEESRACWRWPKFPSRRRSRRTRSSPCKAMAISTTAAMA